MRDLIRGGAVALTLLASIVGCVNASSEPENTAAACSDGKDNDLDGSTDCFDINCIAFSNCTPPDENCAGGFDEDQDGLTDCEDPECVGDPACVPAGEDCTDTIDNDGDGLIDCQDPACDNDPICPDEICSNNQDDDQDGDIDCEDVECAAEPNCELTEICDNGVDDDNDTLSDCNDADCANAPNCNAENCTDTIDNDGDGFVDCDDTNCITNPACSPNATCGDGVRNQVSEACDGADLAGETCVTQGFQSGNISCNAGCTLNTSGCVAAPTCGNGNLDAGEQCDGANLAGQNCVSRGFDGGTLLCGGGCQFDTGSCFNIEDCVNGIDDDSDGQADCADSECAAAPSCQAPAHGTCATPTVANAGSVSGNTIGGGSANISEGNAPDIFSPPCLVGSGQPEDIYIFTMPDTTSQFLAVDVISVSADLGLYIREAGNAAQCSDITREIGCTDIVGGGGTEHLEGTIAAGSILHFFVDGCETNCVPAGNSAGAYTLVVTIQ
jgi:hypothetical protein